MVRGRGKTQSGKRKRTPKASRVMKEQGRAEHVISAMWQEPKWTGS